METPLVKVKLEIVDESPTPKTNRREYNCDICKLKLFSRSGIRRHMYNKHMGLNTSFQLKTELCTICGTYTTRGNFKEHVKSHSTARDHKCHICGTAVKSIFTLRKHIRRLHTKERNFVCVTCGKKLLTRTELLRHEEKHRTDGQSFQRNFECTICHHLFTSSKGLTDHQIKHNEIWAFECGLCSKVFKHSSSVSGHRKSHKVDGFYHCGCCDDRFKDFAQLKTHFLNKRHSFRLDIEK